MEFNSLFLFKHSSCSYYDNTAQPHSHFTVSESCRFYRISELMTLTAYYLEIFTCIHIDKKRCKILILVTWVNIVCNINQTHTFLLCLRMGRRENVEGRCKRWSATCPPDTSAITKNEGNLISMHKHNGKVKICRFTLNFDLSKIYDSSNFQKPILGKY